MRSKNPALLFALIFAAFLSGCYNGSAVPANGAAVEKANRPAKTAKPQDLIKGTVVHISDGDTFIIENDGGERTTVRIHAIDAPELSQAFGKESREALRALIANQTVEIRKQKSDQYRRIVGDVFSDGKDIGLEQIKNGFAWHYKQFQKEQSLENRKFYTDAEDQAKSSGLGLWQDAQPMPPWDYRRAHGNPYIKQH
jgi:endonuclease YncB( thermonuclease family)